MGFQLIFDGLPQKSSVKNNDEFVAENVYMYTFDTNPIDPDASNLEAEPKTPLNIYFTPIHGKKGDKIPFGIRYMYYPELGYLSDEYNDVGSIPHSQFSGSSAYPAFIIMNEDAPSDGDNITSFKDVTT